MFLYFQLLRVVIFGLFVYIVFGSKKIRMQQDMLKIVRKVVMIFSYKIINNFIYLNVFKYIVFFIIFIQLLNIKDIN